MARLDMVSGVVKLSRPAFDLANSLGMSLDPALLPLKSLPSETIPEVNSFR